MLLHQPKDFRSSAVSMLDRLDAGKRGAAHAFRSGCVSRDSASAALCRVNDELQFLQRKRGSGYASRTPDVVGVNLDPIGAFPDLIPKPNQVLAIGLFGALRHAPLRSKTLRAIAAGRNDGARDHEHSRPRDDALLDGLLETDICIAGTLGSKVANRCEAGHQRAAQMVRRTCNAQRKSLECILIVPRGLTVRMQQDMRMPFDQAR